MSLKKALLRLARKVVEHVISELTRQLNVIQDQTVNPMQLMVQQVTGGIWKGQGADEFARVVTSLVVPDTQKFSNELTTVSKNLRFAMDRIDQADTQAGRLFQQWGDLAGKIF